MPLVDGFKIWLALLEEQVAVQVSPCLVPFTLLLVSLLPLMAFSIILPMALVPIVAIATVPFLYCITNDSFQTRLFALNRTESHLLLFVPLQVVMFAWGFLLISLHKTELVMSVLGLHMLLLLVAISPILRMRLSKQARKWSYSRSFMCVGAVVVFLEGSSLMRYFT